MRRRRCCYSAAVSPSAPPPPPPCADAVIRVTQDTDDAAAFGLAGAPPRMGREEGGCRIVLGGSHVRLPPQPYACLAWLAVSAAAAAVALQGPPTSAGARILEKVLLYNTTGLAAVQVWGGREGAALRHDGAGGR